MRRLLILVLLGVAMVIAQAQEQTLALSKAMIVIRIANPQQQLSTFAPLVSQVDAAMADGKSPMPLATTGLNMLYKQYAALPGVDPNGTVILAMMPPTETALQQAMAAPAQMAAADMTLGMVPSMAPMYAIVPLKDGDAFGKFLAASPAGGKPALKGVVCGKQAILSVSPIDTAYTAVNDDVTFQTKYEIAIRSNMQNFNIDALQQNLSPMVSGMMGSLFTMLREQQANMQFTEIGLTMQGDTLAMEGFVTPMPESPLAKSLAMGDTEPIATTYAGYLPSNLAVCAASGPVYAGAPGMGMSALTMVADMLGLFVPPPQYTPFHENLQTLMTQCSQGRALGITYPEAGKGAPTLVAVYKVTDARTGRRAMHNFIAETITLRDGIMDGALGSTIKIFPRVNAEVIGGVQVDLVKVIVKRPAPVPQAGKKPVEPAPIVIVSYFATVDDKLLCAVGDDSKTALAGMIARVHSDMSTDGYTQTAAYQSMAERLPTNVHSFQAVSLPALGKSLVAVASSGQENATAMKWLSQYPTNAPILAYQDDRNGQMYGEILVPKEQTKFMMGLLKLLATNAPSRMQPAAR